MTYYNMITCESIENLIIGNNDNIHLLCLQIAFVYLKERVNSELALVCTPHAKE